VKDQIRKQIRKLVFRPVADDELLVSTNVLDSIAIVDLAVALENESGITIPFTDISKDNFDSINLINQYLQSRGVAVAD
jgi:acyl carrier protein